MPSSIKEVARRSANGLDPRVKRHMDHLISPLLGPVRRLVSVAYDASGPSLFTMMPELVDVHRRVGLPSAPQYHVGGYGFTLEEAVMRALGESVERAAQVTFHTSNPELISRHPQSELVETNARHLPLSEVGRFTREQQTVPGFPFKNASETTPISWVRAIDLRDDAETLLPIQVISLGWMCTDEPRVTLAVSTGTAAHTTYGRALLGGISELLQIDATMGHWYSHSTAPRIEVSPSSTPRFAHFWDMYSSWLDRTNTQIEFYWLRQPDGFPVYPVACALRSPGNFPAVVLGLGNSTDLEQAMYSALCESIPISLVAIYNALERTHGSHAQAVGQTKRDFPDLPTSYRSIDPRTIKDFDTSVGYYAWPEHAEQLFPARFDPQSVVGGPEILRSTPPLGAAETLDRRLEMLLSQVKQKHRLYAVDLTAPDVVELGFQVVRVFSPDLMSLCLPSFPEADHPRYSAYGGFRSSTPHPYP